MKSAIAFFRVKDQPKWERGIPYVCLFWGVLGLLFCLHLYGPTRINADAHRLVTMGASFLSEGRFVVYGEEDFLPRGYPLLIALLMRLQLLSGELLLIGNVVAVATAAVLWYYALEKRLLAIYGIFLATVSWIGFKHTLIPLTDSLFLPLLPAIILCLRSRRMLWGIGAALLLVVVFVQIRFVAVVALVPIYLKLTEALGQRLPQAHRWPLLARDPVILSLRLLPLLLLVPYALGQIGNSLSYFHYFLTPILADPLAYVRQCLLFRGQEMSELFACLPPSLSERFPVFTWLGIGLALWLCYRSFRFAGFWSVPHLFLLVFFCWPYFDCRFWLPVYPYLCYLILLELQRWHVWWALVYTLVFTAISLLLAMVSLQMQYSEWFPEMYLRGDLREEYRAAAGDYRSLDRSLYDVSFARAIALLERRPEPPLEP